MALPGCYCGAERAAAPILCGGGKEFVTVPESMIVRAAASIL
jgi:hypothetical protein